MTSPLHPRCCVHEQVEQLVGMLCKKFLMRQVLFIEKPPELPEIDLASDERSPGDVVVPPLDLRILEEVPVAAVTFRGHESLLQFWIKGKGSAPCKRWTGGDSNPRPVPIWISFCQGTGRRSARLYPTKLDDRPTIYAVQDAWNKRVLRASSVQVGPNLWQGCFTPRCVLCRVRVRRPSPCHHLRATT